MVNMAASFFSDVFPKVATFRHILSSSVFSRQYAKAGSVHLHNDAGHKTAARLFANRFTHAYGATMSTPAGSYFNCRDPVIKQSDFTPKYILSSALLKPALPYCLVPARHYGRKMRQKPPRPPCFDYSGDLRNLPELDKSTILYKYRGMEDQIEGDEVLKKLCSLEFASAQEYADHRRQLIIDRIQELFGPDSKLEQQIALLTLAIRQMIPYCLKYRKDKVNKVQLQKNIFRRKKLLNWLRLTDFERLEWLLGELKIRYVIPKEREEYKGWKHNLRESKRVEATNKQRKKLAELKEKFEAEKQVFFEHKAKVMAEIEEDLNKFGLNKDFLDKLLVEENEAAVKQQQQQDNTNQGKQA